MSVVINFLFLWSICPCSYFVRFQNGLAYFTRATAHLSILLMKFLLLSFVSRSFYVHLKYTYLICSFINASLMMTAFNNSMYFQVSFYPRVLIISRFGSSITSVISYFHFSWSARHIFLFQIRFQYSGCLSYCLYQCLQFLFFSCKLLDVVHLLKAILLLMWFCKFVAPLCVLPKYVIEEHHCYYKK